MRQESTPCTIGAPTGRTLAFSSIPMAIHEMGDGYSRVIVARSRKGPNQKIGEREVADFLWENIIFRFGIPNEIVIGSKVIKFLEDLKIKRITSSPYHLSAYGQAESTNNVIIQKLKKRLETAKDEEANNKALLVKLELLDERRHLAYIRMMVHKQRIKRFYNWRDNLRYFKVGDLILRKVTHNTREINIGKLSPAWEGPYRVLAVTGKGSYEMENQDGVKLPSNWNVTHLKRYYC
ncbi:uncharacterized protein [Nicotiana tomentosiformis]|uniref:uncharacterized protein n=1 Tax=Nicotiana tomentosiformis TaxID=4098 RepID=UPI00388C5716